jgi:hypothetical protein
LEGLKRLVGIPAPVWAGFIQQVGDPGTNVQHLASVPAFVVAQACAAATLADGTAFHPINATQVGLVWRVARKTVFLKNGGNEEDFIDTEPWDNPRNQGNQNQGPPAVPDPPTRSSGVKGHVLKMASLLDQSDESELVPAPTDKVQEWVLRYVTTMGSTPEEEEEATDAQLAALYKRTVVLKQAPYCDFSVWTPFGRRALRSQKFRREGSYLVKELPGPQNLQQWMASWRVFKVAAISLGIVSLSALQQYEKLIERLTLHWPQAWGLIALADDKGRAERLEKLRRGVIVDLQAGRPIPLDWDENNPWSVCFKLLAKDDNFLSEQVRHPASAWLAAGGRGAPVAPSDIIAATHLAGGTDVVNSLEEEAPERRKQSNRDKRLARKRRLQDERDELLKLRHQKDGHGHAGGKAGGKGKSKDKGGAEICFSWAQGKGPCADVVVGGECKGRVKRAHKCQHCLSPGHKNDGCPQK